MAPIFKVGWSSRLTDVRNNAIPWIVGPNFRNQLPSSEPRF